MPQYFYKAKNLKGKEREGVIEVQDKKALALILKSEGFFLLSAKADSQQGRKKSFAQYLQAVQSLLGVSLTEKLFFTRNLSIMLKTGVSLVRAFEILSSQTKNKKFQKILLDISKKVNKGESLSGALGGFPKIFSSLYQETVKVGEETGKLESSLQILSIQMEKEHALKSKVKSAMVYPGVVLCMAFLIGIFMMIFAVPQMKKAFSEMEIKLPITTRMIIGTADMLTHHWFLVSLFVVGLAALIVFLLKSGKGGKIKSAVAIKMPLVSKITKQSNSALTLRTLSSLLSAGVPIVRSLEIASGALGNYFFQEALKKSAVDVEKGQKLSLSLKPYESIFAPMVLQMMEIGEETGETSAVLLKLAEFFEDEVSASTDRLSSVIEPILILFIGCIVGFFAVSMIQPMFSVMGGVQ